MAEEGNKLWGGRFSVKTDSLLEKLNSSIQVDKRLYAEDLFGSQKYAEAIQKANLITKEESKSICEGLEQIKIEWDSNNFQLKPEDEDIHTANERRLKELIGLQATKLHVGRSRNDQVITDMKLWLHSAIMSMTQHLLEMITVMVTKANEEIDVIMPGYTHLQRAQPIRFSHWLLSHAWNLKADIDRVVLLKDRGNVSPLGSGAIAGNPFKINRQNLATDLGFVDYTRNSMQAVGDRDFVVEFLFWASLTGVHLTRLAEDIILYSSKEFNFIRIHDSFSTGSSLMPQKRNADSWELIRGISAQLFGEFCGFMMVMKGLPSTYNKDLQNDKEAIFTIYDKLSSVLTVATGAIKTMQINSESCRAALSYDMLATDIAYYLVRKGVAFREAHFLAGKVVALAEELHVALNEIKLTQLQTISNHFEADISKVWNFENSVEQYQSVGGTSRASVLCQIKELDEWTRSCASVNVPSKH